MRQLILVLSTERSSIRSEVVGWDQPEGGHPGKHSTLHNFQSTLVGLIEHMRVNYHYQTPLHAILDGWRLLAPPVKQSENEYEWWLEQ